MFDMNKRSHLVSGERLIKQYFINCWHMNDHENFAMWKIYSEPFGVCIQSTYSSLIDYFCDPEYSFYKNTKIYAGEVKYIDWESDVMPKDNLFVPLCTRKRIQI